MGSLHSNFATDLLSFFLWVGGRVVGTRSLWIGEGKGSQNAYLIQKVREKAMVAKCCLLFLAVFQVSSDPVKQDQVAE